MLLGHGALLPRYAVRLVRIPKHERFRVSGVDGTLLTTAELLPSPCWPSAPTPVEVGIGRESRPKSTGARLLMGGSTSPPPSTRAAGGSRPLARV
jgi:hypothetical protein